MTELPYQREFDFYYPKDRELNSFEKMLIKRCEELEKGLDGMNSIYKKWFRLTNLVLTGKTVNNKIVQHIMDSFF